MSSKKWTDIRGCYHRVRRLTGMLKKHRIWESFGSTPQARATQVCGGTWRYIRLFRVYHQALHLHRVCGKTPYYNRSPDGKCGISNFFPFVRTMLCREPDLRYTRILVLNNRPVACHFVRYGGTRRSIMVACYSYHSITSVA